MIRFSNIYEGVLGGVDKGLNDMDKGLEAAMQEKLYSLFPSVNGAEKVSSPLNIRHLGTYWGGLVLEKFIKTCCSISNNIVTIDLSKSIIAFGQSI